MRKYDIIIIGAGPAGLSAAVELSNQNANVLLIDKGKIGDTDKTWCAWGDQFKEHGMDNCISRKCNSF